MSAARLTVYIIEDDPAVGDSLSALLESSGYATRLFPSSATFLDAYDGSRAGCLLLNCHSPGVSALDLLACLATRRIGLPTILMTAGHDPVVAAGAAAAGSVTLIDKPFDRTSLLKTIDRTLSRPSNAA
jgi:two-component system response regulator FixJ